MTLLRRSVAQRNVLDYNFYMDVTAEAHRDCAEPLNEDSFVHLCDATWEDYERLLDLRGEHSAPRISYLEGVIEIMSPSRGHENIKSLIGCLVEAWCLERGVRFTTLGAWTLKNRPKGSGVEPDECYIFGDPDAARPHLAIEVEWTHGGIDKLEIYRKLEVEEVWYWRKGRLQVWTLRGERYEPTEASEVLPAIDIAELVSFIDRPTTFDAIQDYRAALRGVA